VSRISARQSAHETPALSSWVCAFISRSVTALAAAFAGALLLASANGFAQTADVLNRDATQALSEGHADAALPKLQKAARLAPRNPHIQFNLGLALLRTGKLSEAVAPLSKAKQDPSLNAEARFLLGVDYFEARKYAQAIAELTGLDGGSHAERVLYMLEESNRYSGQLEQAKQAFRALNERYPDSAWTHYLMATAYEGQQQMDNALAEYKQALKKDPSIPNVNFAIGYIYWRRQDTEEARKWLEIENRSGCHSLANYFLGEIARSNKDEEKAQAYYRRSIACDPSYADAHLRLGMMLANQKRYTEAIQEFKSAIRLKPEQSSAHYHLASLYRRLGQTANAKAEYDEVKRIQAAANESTDLTEGTNH
jgi:tetratricopeptide (TPR) repeat protein